MAENQSEASNQPGHLMPALMWNSVGVLVAVGCVSIMLVWLYLLGRVAFFFVAIVLSFVP